MRKPTFKAFSLSKEEAFALWLNWDSMGLSERRMSALYKIFGGTLYSGYQKWAKKQRELKD